jgi:plasmid stabilization system protein ParE
VHARFRSEAVEDVEAAKAWYNEQRDGLGDDFVAALENAIRLIVEFPEAFPEIAARHRRALLHRFPYALYYRVEGDVLEVLACLHGSRSPETWRSRD